MLAAFLSSIDVRALAGHDRVVVLRAHQRMASHYQAHVYGDMAAVSEFLEDDLGGDIELATEASSAEIRVALRLTRRAADTELALALDLKERLPTVWGALVSGEIDPRRARTIAHGTGHLPRETARTVVERVIGDASGMTTGQLGARIRRLCIEADPAQAESRFTEAVAERRIAIQPSEAGTAHLFAHDLPPARATAAATYIDNLARTLKTASESRTMDQLRADVFLDLLCGTTSATGARIQGGVEIKVELTTLAGLADAPGDLAGYGPVIADIARHVTEQQRSAQWRFTVTDPATGQPIANGITRRRPTASQRRQVETLYPTCVFPGCRMPATACDLDHRTPFSEGGPTTVTNLGPLCRHDHRIRHQAGWTHRALPDGDHQWTTKLGHTYTTSGKPP